MRKDNLTALLTDLRALILKSRPAYRDFLGEVTETKTTKILENVVLAENPLMLPVADAAFSGFISGKAYRVIVNGEETSVVAKDSSEGVFLSNVEDISNPPSDYWVIGYIVEQGKMIALTDGSFLGTTISVYYDETVTEQRWSVRKLAYELLPDRLLLALSTAANTARKAQSTADAAQSTADAARSTADAARSDLGNVTAKVQAEISFTFDKQISGRDSFTFNGYNYYKISGFSPAPADVINFSGTRANGAALSTIKIGKNSCSYGFFAVVTKAGTCSLPITSTVSGSFTAPSTGLYAQFEDGNDFMTAGSAVFEYIKRDLIVTSPTHKKYRITVDDAGTLSATEVTDTTT